MRGRNPGYRKPDWDFWLIKKKVAVWQAVALSIDIDPDHMQPERYAFMAGHSDFPIFENSSFPNSEAKETYEKRLRLIKDVIGEPGLFTLSSLSLGGWALCELPLHEFSSWLLSTGISNMPPELLNLTTTSPSSRVAATEKSAEVVDITDAPQNKELSNWKMKIQAEAARQWKALEETGASPTKNNIKNDLARWCRDNNVRTDNGIFPDAEYISRHVIRNWTPPRK